MVMKEKGGGNKNKDALSGFKHAVSAFPSHSPEPVVNEHHTHSHCSTQLSIQPTTVTACTYGTSTTTTRQLILPYYQSPPSTP